MCLISNFDHPSIADRDLTCYKVYVFINDQYKSPYQKADMPKIGELATTSLQESGTYLVEKGFHSFVSILDASNEAFSTTYIYKHKSYVFKCTIPKDTKYYEGRFNSIPSYCSESIIIEEILDTKLS